MPEFTTVATLDFGVPPSSPQPTVIIPLSALLSLKGVQAVPHAPSPIADRRRLLVHVAFLEDVRASEFQLKVCVTHR